jgi:hypothetical protein
MIEGKPSKGGRCMNGSGLGRLRGVLLVAFVLSGFGSHAWAVEVGQKAPDFTLPGTTDRPVRLSQYAGKQVVVLHFYLGDFLEA